MSNQIANQEFDPRRYRQRSKSIYSPRAVIVVGMICLLVGWCSKAWNDGTESSRCSNCQNNLRQIGLALRNYVDNHGTLPPAYLRGEDGQPTNSWRALLAGYWAYNFPGSGFDLGKPWNDPKNAVLGWSRSALPVYKCSEHFFGDDSPIASYVAVVGPNTMWPVGKPATPAEDGSDGQKILVIEVINSDINWLEPRDLTLEQALNAIQPEAGIGIGSKHRRGINYLSMDGAVRVLDRNVDRESLRKMLVR